jgi:hypothetical protein
LQFEILPNGVKKKYNFGYSIVYGNIEDCFTDSERDDIIVKLQSLPVDCLSEEEKTLLTKLKDNRRNK